MITGYILSYQKGNIALFFSSFVLKTIHFLGFEGDLRMNYLDEEQLLSASESENEAEAKPTMQQLLRREERAQKKNRSLRVPLKRANKNRPQEFPLQRSAAPLLQAFEIPKVSGSHEVSKIV